MGISNFNDRSKHNSLTKELLKEYHKRVSIAYYAFTEFSYLLIDNGAREAHRARANRRNLGPSHKSDWWYPCMSDISIRDLTSTNTCGVGCDPPRKYYFSSGMHNHEGYNNKYCHDVFVIQGLKDRIKELENQNRELQNENRELRSSLNIFPRLTI
jgi:hypothetical protein